MKISRGIAFTGMPGSGKTEAVKVAKETGLIIISMGNLVRDETKKRGLNLTDINLGKIADNMRKKHGMDIWAQKCLQKLSQIDFVIIDGIRNIEEVEVFKNNIKNFVLVAIHSSPDTRYKRLFFRQRLDNGIDKKELTHREKRELSWGLGNVIAMADIVVINEGTLSEFKEKIHSILLSIS
jgi:dephospho-CoA kinase